MSKISSTTMKPIRHQQHNLAADPAFAEIRAELKDKLIAELVKAGEEAPTILPADGPGPDATITGTAASHLDNYTYLEHTSTPCQRKYHNEISFDL